MSHPTYHPADLEPLTGARYICDYAAEAISCQSQRHYIYGVSINLV